MTGKIISISPHKWRGLKEFFNEYTKTTQTNESVISYHLRCCCQKMTTDTPKIWESKASSPGLKRLNARDDAFLFASSSDIGLFPTNKRVILTLTILEDYVSSRILSRAPLSDIFFFPKEDKYLDFPSCGNPKKYHQAVKVQKDQVLPLPAVVPHFYEFCLFYFFES